MDARPTRRKGTRIEVQFRASTAKEKVMSNKPSHIAHVVEQPKEGSDRKAIWHRVAAVCPHSKGNGFDLVIPPGVTLSGRIVCTELKDEDDQSA
jgi:hypothetical protein